MEIWDGCRWGGRSLSLQSSHSKSDLGLALVDLGTLPDFLEGSQPQKLSVSPSITLPVGFQPPREPWPARAQGATWPRSLSHCSSTLDLRDPLAASLRACHRLDVQAPSEVSPQALNFPRELGKVEGSRFHLLQLHRLPLFGWALLGATAPSLSL